MLGKTFKGLTDETLEWQTRELLARETRRDEWTVHVRPELVVEIAFNDVQQSSQYPAGHGAALRARQGLPPRQAADEADTIDTVRRDLPEKHSHEGSLAEWLRLHRAAASAADCHGAGTGHRRCWRACRFSLQCPVIHRRRNQRQGLHLRDAGVDPARGGLPHRPLHLAASRATTTSACASRAPKLPMTRLCEGFEAVEAAREGVPLTYFEFGTLAALWAFPAAAGSRRRCSRSGWAGGWMR